MQTILTSKREYTIEEAFPGFWLATYRPINQKTGRPWQAERGVPGFNCYLATNRKTGLCEVIAGAPVECNRGVSGVWPGYASEHDAINAVNNDIAKWAKQ